MRSEVKTQNTFFSSLIMTTINSEVPVGNKEAVDTLMAGEATPKEFTNYMKLGKKYPAFPYAGGPPFYMTKEWAESYAKGVNETPGALYIRGHEDEAAYKTRVIPSGYVVGAMVTKDEEGNDVLAIRNFFKNPESEATKELVNQTLKEIKAGMLSTSIGDIEKQRWVYLDEPDETGYDVYVEVIESVKKRSNAIVDHDMTASDASIVHTSFSQSSYSDENNDKGINMDAELKKSVTAVKNNFLSGTLSPEELSAGLGIKILNKEQENSLQRLENAEKSLGMPIDEYINRVNARTKEEFASLKHAILSTTFKVKDVLEVAEGLFSIDSGTKEDIDKEVERLANLGAIKTIQAKYASEGSTDLGDSGSDADLSDEYGQEMEG